MVNARQAIEAQSDGGKLLMSDVYQRIREDIIMGRLEAGRKLRIEELKAEYGTGASPLREALSLLIPEGFVDRLENRGFRVSGVTLTDFDDLLDMRCWSESRALRRSIERGGKEWEGEIVLALYWFSQAFPDHDAHDDRASERRRLHKTFHMALIAECGSPMLMELCSRLFDRNDRYRSLVNFAATAERNHVAEHEQIVEAVLRRDADAAVSALAEHYGKLRRQIEPILTP
ncbi:FCD domain-containing protein [Pseudooceanicola sp. 216_PA32_1]|uniref:FCD domain-containing protein n=1 Tax=Pseudooceanicola pacificus TaxID=2676438 RepID=A0A844WFB3_9RHOB|nr:FCD domain-containing protein [Pseudooceanicola pacificus]MWB79050.1 FCD domain-containing protein [Pseudooceanicola pacificus]